MKSIVFNSLKITFSVVGAVIGAGFITGREIVRFFYGLPVFAVVFTEFILFFLLFNFLMTVKNNKFIDFFVKVANICVYIISFFIIASMLGAIDSLFSEAFGLSRKIPIGSILLLIFSTAICFGGIDKIEKANAVIVPFMSIAVAAILLIYGKNFLAYYEFDCKAAVSCISYGCMNALLSQPFFLKLKRGYTAVGFFCFLKENKNKGFAKRKNAKNCPPKTKCSEHINQNRKREFSPFLVSMFSSLILSFLIARYLKAIDEFSALKDIPLLFIVGKNKFLRVIIAGLIVCGIITTQFSTEYPLVCLAQKKKRSNLLLLLGIVGVFAVSRLGFYVIVDVIYPVVAAFSAIYYAVLIFATALIFPLKSRINTLKKQECIEESCLSLRDRDLKPARRKQ